ncbi:hypothetical protein HDA32_000123 [Spinactinospora alkalitolerans]|uniref:HNH endonuclease n=1 Tax=Spinactinospora alkalitolerans TaxID=687207 RepID=A0A852TQQ2_9ACTN|nr:hypothetical protein [Spinactinospora alkalitolerans]NYE45003.1 hypothetical protein [Spinactinospora alkalitolerans]
MARRRARLAGLPDDGSGIREWLERHEDEDRWQCHLCFGSFQPGDEIQWDHLDPIAGGEAGTAVENVRAAHGACNISRRNTPLDVWYARVGTPEEAAA